LAPDLSGCFSPTNVRGEACDGERRKHGVEKFLRQTPVIDWKHTDVLSTAKLIAKGTTNTQETAKRCFEWVRDKIQHSVDFRRNPLTCSASEVLRSGTGYCYAKVIFWPRFSEQTEYPRGSAISDSASMKLARCIHCMA